MSQMQPFPIHEIFPKGLWSPSMGLPANLSGAHMPSMNIKQSIGKVSNKYRTKFVKEEFLQVDEGETNEYKGYTWPLNKILEDRLKHCINAFLNQKGGRIFIGINEYRCVKGIKLSMQDRTRLKLKIKSLIGSFEPSIFDKDLVTVVFYNVVDAAQNKPIPGLFVVKVLVKQGEPSDLYSEDNREFRSYIRIDTEDKLLTVQHIKDYILKRKFSPSSRVDPQEFDDVEQPEIVDAPEEEFEEKAFEQVKTSVKEAAGAHYESILSTSSDEQSSSPPNSEEHSQAGDSSQLQLPLPSDRPQWHEMNQRNKFSNKGGYVVQLRDLPPIYLDEFTAIFCGSTCPKPSRYTMYEIDPRKNKACNSSALISYETKQDAQNFVNRFNGSIIQGGKINVFLKS